MHNAHIHNIYMHIRHSRNFRTAAAAKVNSCLFNKKFSLPGFKLYSFDDDIFFLPNRKQQKCILS